MDPRDGPRPGVGEPRTVDPAGRAAGSVPQERSADHFLVEAPAIAPPKGGGALRGIGEKFAANPVTGTGSLTIPVATTPGRAGFGPSLALAYDSGAGNGPFGFGYSLGLPSITRRTDRGLPRYQDAEESDVFVLAGAEDLVPDLAVPERLQDGFRVRRYRPRVESGFARVERWSRPGDTSWRSISRDGTTTVFGDSADSRIADPADPSRIFSWLVSETFDDHGNSMVYSYAREDSAGVDHTRPHQRHRPAGEGANRYLKRIRWANRTPRISAADLAAMEWLLELVLDYGEGHWEEISATSVRASPTPEGSWPERPDAFSTYRPGFEVRTSRRCHRLLMFHRFPELGPEPLLVRSTELDYADLADPSPDAEAELAHPGSTRAGSFLCAVTQRGHVLDATQPVVARGGARYRTYGSRTLPPLQLAYSRAAIDETVRQVDAESLRNLPQGADGTRYRFVDLDGEGLPGVLSAQGGAWYYKRNLATGTAGATAARLGPVELLPEVPAVTDLTAWQLLDLGGTGRLDVVRLGGASPGYFQRTAAGGWERFRTFPSVPSSASAAAARLVDLSGDGLADLLQADEDGFTWYPSLGKDGFDGPVRAAQLPDLELGPRLVPGDPEQGLFLADMSGDGLHDLVRVRNGEVCYWPNLGYGRFGPRIVMDGSPRLDAPERFDHRRIRLADLDGSGTTDLVYLGAEGVTLYFNQAGNGFGGPRRLRAFPTVDGLATADLVDLLGCGTSCLVWSSPGLDAAERPMRYVDLMGGVKPHLLVSIDNNLGCRTELSYTPSTRFYLADRAAGAPWATRLAFPVQCLARVKVTDRVRGAEFTSAYSYHHGFYDGVEREFRGFGRVEQVDVETFTGLDGAHDPALDQPPVKTITWFDTGAGREHEELLARYRAEYFRFAGPAPAPEETTLPADLAPDEWQEALRACKGTALRREVYALDPAALPAHRPVRLFTAVARGCRIRRLQGRGPNRHAAFLATPSEEVTWYHELDLQAGGAPDPRVTHTLNLLTDRYGHVLQAVTAAYPRAGRHVDPALPLGLEDTIAALQGTAHLRYEERRFTEAVDDARAYRLPAPAESLTFELTGLPPGPLTVAGLRSLALSDRYPAQVEPPATPTPVGALAYNQRPTGGIEKRLLAYERTLYFDDALAGPRPLGEQGARGLVFEAYRLALTDAHLGALLEGRLDAEVAAALGDPARSGYLSGAPAAARFGAGTEGQHWSRSGVARPDPAHFFLPTAYQDPFGNPVAVAYANDLVVVGRTDALGNSVTVPEVDWRVVAPARIRDANDNETAIVHDALGLPAAVAVLAAGDDLAGIDAELDPARREGFFTGDYDEATARALLGNATARHLYHHGERLEPDGTLSWGHHPAAAATLLRERHRGELPAGGPLQASFEYSDGAGAALVTKAQAEPATGTTALRWIASGKVVLNNKGNPVKRYEPYFSAAAHRFEEPVAVGVASVVTYDALGRTVRTEAPDGSYERVERSPWHAVHHDADDTVGEAGNRWYASHAAAGAAPEQQRAAAAALEHAGTPETTFLDAQGREAIAVHHDRLLYPGDAAPAERRDVIVTTLDAGGRPLWIRDPRGNLVVQHIRPAMADGATVEATQWVPGYGLTGSALFQHAMDSGDRWTLDDATGAPMFAWDANERAGVMEARRTETRYDALHRPVDLWLRIDAGAAALVERMTYGEGQPGDRARNLRGRLQAHRDQAGLVAVQSYDHAGRPLETTRQLAADGAASPVDWQTAALDPEVFTELVDYDALGRVRRRYGWHRADGRVAVYEPTYGARGLLAGESLVVGAKKTAAGYDEGPGSVRTAVLSGLEYDARGQRQAVHQGNGTITRFTYDRETFRLVQLRTTRPGFDPPFPDGAGQLASPLVVQNLHYTYDPAGNVTEVRDDAFRPAFFANQRIEPVATYTYDALYRLIAATGREQVGADVPGAVEPPALSAVFPVAPGDPADQQNYTDTYRYDPAGNLIEHRHLAAAGWTRTLEYEATSNRLARSWMGTDVAGATIHAHDTHGNLLNLANVPVAQRLRWDHRDLLQAFDRGGGGIVHYQYDAGKQRARKVAIGAGGAKGWERLYLGGTEVYRRFTGGAVVEEIETHHLQGADGDRVLLVEDVRQTDRTGAATGPLFRYQYANHLGSSCLELDDQAAVITYEEYHPYGTTAYRTARSQAEAPKRYRFTGMERDEESGLGYHGARYQVPWLGRWASCDPKGLADGISPYPYCRSAPTMRVDPEGTDSERRPEPPAPEPAPAPDSPPRSEAKGDPSQGFLGIPAAVTHSLAEGIIWNRWFGPNAPDQVVFSKTRGFIIDRLAGNNLGLYQELVDKRVGNVVVQVKSFYRTGARAAQELGGVIRSATRDAAQYVRSLPRAQRLARLFPRAEIVMPSWAPARLEQAAQTALNTARAAREAVRDLPLFARAAQVTRGIPGMAGTAARVLSRVAVPLMVAGLGVAVYRGDRLGVADNTIGLLPFGLEALAKVPAVGSLAPGVARLGHVAAAFAAGWAAGRLIDEHLLSDETRNTIGGAVNEIVNESGWKEIAHNPFGLRTLYHSLAGG